MTPEESALWEAAYCRFETPEEEIRKFMSRLVHLGCAGWARESRIVELFCGRGNGLKALERLGFSSLEGVDLSARLATSYNGPAAIHVADCRQLSFQDHSKDLLIVQGGLHHLLVLPEDLEQTLVEARRVLKSDGRLVLVEPWKTPFLRFVHFAGRSMLLRKISNKLDALEVMTHYERTTYEFWLNHPELVLSVLRKHFDAEQLQFRWGKIYFIGRPRFSALS